MHQHMEPGKWIYLVTEKMGELSLLLYMSFWGEGGGSAAPDLHVPMPFGKALLSQLSAPWQSSSGAKRDGAALHQLLYFVPKNLPVLHRGVQAPPLSQGVKPRHTEINIQTFLLGFRYSVLATLGGVEHQQRQAKP